VLLGADGNPIQIYCGVSRLDWEPMSVLARESWGPLFWTILHTLAECSGQQTNTVLDIDERTAWSVLLKAQMFVMPCALCRKHFQEWLTAHRVARMDTLNGNERMMWLRKWLWGCHARVNELNGKESPAFESLPQLFPRVSLEPAMIQVSEMFKKALEQQQLKPDDIHRWRQQISRLRVLYGI
jgi:hypothetical protein